MKIAILISNAGTGTNLQSIIDGIAQGKIKAEIAAVVSDKTDAPGLERAKNTICRLHLPKKRKPAYYTYILAS